MSYEIVRRVASLVRLCENPYHDRPNLITTEQMMNKQPPVATFDTGKLDALMDREGIDVVLASSRHNVRYLTGGFYNWFHLRSARASTQRYLSYVGVPKGRLDDAFYVGGQTERGQVEASDLWVSDIHLTEPPKSPFFQSVEAATTGALDCLKKRGFDGGRVGIELAYLPANAYDELRRELPNAQLVDVTPILGELRAVKTPEELDILRRNAEASVRSIQAAVTGCQPGVTTNEIQRRLQAEMSLRGIEMQWLIICMGQAGVSTKWPSDQEWAPGEVLRIDPGTSLDDYVADLCRMAVLGEPSDLANTIINDCIAMSDALQEKIRPGMTCGELYDLGQKLLGEMSYPEYGWHIAHGCGMVPHEPPMVRGGDPSYVLQPGMVMSMELQCQHPEVGDVKVEDIVAVTEDGCECFTMQGREWTVA